MPPSPPFERSHSTFKRDRNFSSELEASTSTGEIDVVESANFTNSNACSIYIS
ncbi:MAG: hypothetical protein AB1861_12835 [Cyanobacteriota bacterium]